MKLIFESPVTISKISFDDSKVKLASSVGNSLPGKFALKSVHTMSMNLSVEESLSKSSKSSEIFGLPKVATDALTPLFSPLGLVVKNHNELSNLDLKDLKCYQ